MIAIVFLRGDTMAEISKAQQKCVSRYEAANYDKILVRLPKGQREAVKAQADAAGKSLNAYLIGLIEGENPAPAPQAPQYLTPDALDKATQAAQAAGEELEAWITRAICDTAQRDSMIRQLKR